MDIANVLETLKNVISTNEAIKAYCQAKYSKDHTVYVFVNPDDMPPEEDYPVVVIYSVYRSQKGEGQTFKIYNALIGVGVRREESTRVGNVVTYIGGIEVEELRELVEYSIFGGGVALKTSVTGETVTEVQFPIFRSDTTIELQYRASTRGPLKKE
jgi:hypothetical protein